MSTSYPPNSILQSKSPLVHVFSTPELDGILARSSFPTLASFLSAFESGVEKVTVRLATGYEQKILPRFGVHFVQRSLPPGFGDEAAAGAGGAINGRRRSSTTTSNPLNTSTNTSAFAPSPAIHTPSTPYAWPTQAERDELFLDSIGSDLARRADEWISHPSHAELKVQPKRARRRPRGEDDVPEGEEAGGVFEEEKDIDEGWQGRGVEAVTPWYAAVRDKVLQRREMVEWETFGQPVACLLALSSSHPDPLNALSALWDLTSPARLFTPSAYPPLSGAEEDGRAEWTAPEVLRVVVLVHDFGAGGGRDGWEDAKDLHETIRKTYGHHTSILPLFSAAPTSHKPQPRAPDLAALWPGETSPLTSPPSTQPAIGLGVSDNLVETPTATTGPPIPGSMVEKGHELSEDDLKAARLFLREFVVQSLVPWLERAVVVGNEQFVASRKSIGGRLFSAGRRYFGGSGKSSPVSSTGQPLGYNPLKGYYPHQTQHAQTRRLADLAFMLGDYKLAADVYDHASRDYRDDKAWRYFSSASRMAGLSQLLQLTPGAGLSSNPDDWLALAMQTPIGLQPGAPIDMDALQAVMLYYEAYIALGDWRAAPAGLVRTAGESEEVAAGLLLEQAAIADLHLPMPSRRKFGFHMTMAAARYEKSGIKSLSRRCLSQAASVFQLPSRPTDLSDPRFPTSSPLSGWCSVRSHLHHSLGRQAYNVGKSADAVEHFLQLLVGAGSDVGGCSVGDDWLDDFALAWEHLGPEEAGRVVAERGLGLPVRVFEAEGARVRVVERDSIAAEDGGSGVWTELERELVPSVGGYRPAGAKVQAKKQEAVVGETFYFELVARNPLDAPLAIGGLQVATDAAEGLVEIEAPGEIELEPREAKAIQIPVRATALGSFAFTSVSYRFNDLLPTTESLVRKPTRLSDTRDQLKTATYVADVSLAVTIQPPVPILNVSLEQLPAQLGAGEMRRVALRVTNCGQVGLTRLRAVCGEPSVALFLTEGEEVGSVSAEGRERVTVSNSLSAGGSTVLPLGGDVLAPGASVEVPLLLRGDSAGHHTLRWMFAFQPDDGTATLTSRASHQLEVVPTLDIRAFVRPGATAGNAHMLAIEVANHAIPAEAVVTQVSALSPLWRVVSLSGDAVEDGLGEGVGWQQSSQVLVAVEPVVTMEGEPSPQAGAEFAVRQLDLLLKGKEINKGIPEDVVLQHSFVAPTAELANLVSLASPASSRLRSILLTHSHLRRQALAAQLPTLSSAQLPHLFPLFSPRSVDLAVFWRVPSTGQEGHHHLADIPLGAGHDALKEVIEEAELFAGGLYAESQRERTALLSGLRRSELGVEENPISVRVNVPAVVEVGEFPARVGVTFVVRNESPAKAASFVLTLGGLGAGANWAGRLVRRGELGPLGEERVDGKVWVGREGVVDVGGWEVVVEGGRWRREGEAREVRVVLRK